MAKSNAEKCKAYYEKNKAKKKAKYRAQHGEFYYTVKNIPMNKELWDFVNEKLDSSLFIGEKNKFSYDDDVMKSLKKVKYQSSKKRLLTDAEKNGLRAAIVYIWNELRQCEDWITIYNSNIRKHSNNIDMLIINQFINLLSDKKMSDNKRLDGRVLLNVSPTKKIINYKNGDQQLANVNQYMKSKMLDKKEIFVDLQLTPVSFKEWNLYTPEMMKTVLDNIDKEPVKKYLYNYGMKNNAYKDIENRFRGFHTSLTEKQLKDIEAYEKIQVDKEAVIKIIDEISFNKSNVDYSLILEVSNMLATLTQRNIVFKHGRIYFKRFTSLKNDYVSKVLLLEGKHLIQLFDVKSCFVLESLMLYSQNMNSDKEEIKKLYQKIVRGDFYVWIGSELKIKQMQKESFEEWRDRCKEKVIKWLFKTSGGKKLDKQVNDLIQQRFPSYYNWITSLEDVYDKTDKRKKSILSVKCQWLENNLVLNNLFNKVKKYNTITKHDAIYITDDQYSEQLKKYIQDEWNKIINKIMKGNQE